MAPPVLSFAAPSGTGKTTLLAEVIERLVGDGLKVGCVKHHGHTMELDTEGKDSWRFRQAGADTMLVTADQVAWMGGGEPPELSRLIDVFYPGADIVLVEGFRSAGLPTILVTREGVHDPTWESPSGTIIATVDVDDLDGALDHVRCFLNKRR